MADGLPYALGDIGSESIATGGISNANLADNAVSGTKVTTQFPVAYTGSPIVGNTTIQYGAAIASDAVVAVSFGAPFAAAPRVIITPQASGTLATQSYVAGTSAGSFVFFGQSGLSHSWIALGSGRI